METGMIRGVVPILPTPFLENGEVDYDAYQALVGFARKSGVAAIGVPAFGSEFYKLDGAERSGILDRVLALATPDLPVMVQCNHACGAKAGKLAREAEAMGATLVATALPRTFTGNPDSLLRYAREVCDATSLPVVVQDWNPGGTTIDAAFILRLHGHCGNFRYAKLEEGGISSLVRNVHEQSDGHVAILSGWGGLYIAELAESGIAGVVPGLALADQFVRIWQFAESGELEALDREFSRILPFVSLSLHHLEQFHHCEKQLLHRRGILPHPAVREVTTCLDPDAANYLNRLVKGIIPLLS